MTRATYLPVPHVFNLNHACFVIQQAFGWGSCYLVGSATARRDYRDVDVRVILDDAEFERLFPGCTQNRALHPLWSLVCAAISNYLEAHTGLPIDFQIQSRTEANNEQEHPGKRIPLGIFVKPTGGPI